MKDGHTLYVIGMQTFLISGFATYAEKQRKRLSTYANEVLSTQQAWISRSGLYILYTSYKMPL